MWAIRLPALAQAVEGTLPPRRLLRVSMLRVDSVMAGCLQRFNPTGRHSARGRIGVGDLLVYSSELPTGERGIEW
jgi:hypothetical protein